MKWEWKWFWRGLGILGAIFMVSLLLQFWATMRTVNVTPVAHGQPLRDGLDIIAIQLDILSLVIAVAGIGLAVAGVIGYQAIKAAAIAKADEVASAAIALYLQGQDKTGTDGGTQVPIEPGDLVELTEEEKG
jgi:hypothetical protein